MIFPYQPIISEAPDGNDFILILRPEVPVIVVGPAGSESYVGLVDTGSDHTILPKSIADELGIALRPASGSPAKAFGGHEVQLLLGEAILKLAADDNTVTWTATVFFYDFPKAADETVVLGHAGFLDYFTAIFDGKLGTLTLLPNDELPIVE
jgi:predicted aspartyl protease